MALLTICRVLLVSDIRTQTGLRKTVVAISGAAVLASVIWLFAAPGYEALVTLLLGVSGLLSQMYGGHGPEQSALPGTDHKGIVEPFESEFWPEEGRPDFEAMTPLLTLHVRPSHLAPLAAELEVAVGSKISFSAFRYRTIRPGKVVARTSGVLDTRNLGQLSYLSRETYYDAYSEAVKLVYREGDSFEYLQYRAEGSCFIRKDGYVFDVQYGPWLGGTDQFALTKEPVAEGWLHVVDSAGKARGWLCAEHGVVRESGRHF